MYVNIFLFVPITFCIVKYFIYFFKILKLCVFTLPSLAHLGDAGCPIYKYEYVKSVSFDHSITRGRVKRWIPVRGLPG